MLRSTRLLPIFSKNNVMRLSYVQGRNLFTPPPVGIDITNYHCAEPVMSKETFQRHYFDIYLPLYKQLNHLLEGSPRRSESCLLTLMRKILDSPGESDIYNVAANIHNHIRFFENLQDRLEVDFDKMSDASKQKIFDNFTSLDRLQYEFECHVEAMYGSGWIWLIDKGGNLEVVSTHDNYSPEATAEGVTTILCLDVWEHAFWKDYGIDKKKYVESFWKNVNWNVVDKRLQEAENKLQTAARVVI